MATRREPREPHSRPPSRLELEPAPLPASRLEEFAGGQAVGTRSHEPDVGIAPRRIDITETDADFRIRAELPGLVQDDLVVEVDGSMLCIRGRQHERREARVEPRCRSFSRSFSLPRSADPMDISAEYQNGVLDVTVGKRPPART